MRLTRIKKTLPGLSQGTRNTALPPLSNQISTAGYSSGPKTTKNSTTKGNLFASTAGSHGQMLNTTSEVVLEQNERDSAMDPPIEPV